MRIHRIASALVLSLVSLLCAASCADPSLELENDDVPAIETQDWSFLYYACIFVQNRGEAVRATFCGSLPTIQLRGQCYSHLNDSPVKWQNYCYDTFYEE